MASFSAARRIILRGSSTRHILPCSRSSSGLNYYAVARSLSSVATTNTHHAPSTISCNYPQHSHIMMSTVAAAIEEDSDSSDNEEEHELPLFSSISELHPSSLHAIEQKMKLKSLGSVAEKSKVCCA